MKKEYILFIIIGILIILISYIITQNITKNTITTTSNNVNTIVKKENTINKQNNKKEVEIISSEYKGYGRIEVVFKNNTGRILEEVKITAKCWDKNGNNLGQNSNGQRNVNTTDTYKINIWCTNDMKKYELYTEYK